MVASRCVPTLANGPQACGTSGMIRAMVLGFPDGLLAALGSCVHASDQIIALYDHEDVLRYANAAYERRFLRGLPLPVSFADVLRHGFAHRFGVHVSSGDVDRFLETILPRRRTAPFRAFEVDTVDGEWIWMTETLVDGWLLSVGSIITRLKDHERFLQRDRDRHQKAADTDVLTGVYNRRRILELAEGALTACWRAKAPCSIVLIDLDHFKAVNDTLGHLAGDELLAQFAAFCIESLRSQDHFGRYGGEEFIVVLPDASHDDAVRAIDRMRARLPPARLTNVPLPHAYTFSAGIAEVHDAEVLSSVLRRVDAALYRAKATGRNRSERAG